MAQIPLKFSDLHRNPRAVLVEAATGWIGGQPTLLDGGEVDNFCLRLLR